MTPKTRLTDMTVRSLPFPEHGQIDYHDDAVPGLCVRVGSKSKTFRLVVGSGANRHRYTIGRYDPPHFTLSMAREKARDILALRRFQPEAPKPSMSYAQGRKLFLDGYHRKESTRYETERLLTRHFAGLDPKPLSKIRAADVAEIIDTLKPSEGRHALTAAKTFFRWCAGREYVDRNPLADMPPIRGSIPRDRVLTNDELSAVWNECTSSNTVSRRFTAIVQLAILTGQRIGQLAALRGEMIDCNKCTITWPGHLMKGNRQHTIPYGALTSLLIATLPETGLLFPTEKGEPFNAWGHGKAKLDNVCSLPHWTLHDLRRTYSTIMASLEVPPHIIERLLDHRGGTISGVAAIYNRFKYEEPCKNAVELYETHLFSIFGVIQVPIETQEATYA